MNFPLTLPRFESRSVVTIKNDINDEIDFHIQCRIDDLVADGISIEEATAQANEAFGCTESIRQQCEQISFAGHRLLTGISLVSLLAMALVTSWLAWQLVLAKSQNAEISRQLDAASIAIAPAAIPQDDFHDLTGTVTGPDGPLADATILVVYKSTPNGQYMQEMFATETDKDGNFVFEDLYSTDSQSGFLVSVVKDGYALKSKYVINKKGRKVKPYKLKVKKAIEKSITILDSDGSLLANTDVFVRSRNVNPSGSRGDMIFPQSRDDVLKTTDEDGKVSMSYFLEKDKAIVSAVVNGNVVDFAFRVDKEAEQTVGGSEEAGKGKSDLTGKVADKERNPIENATVLLVHKDWEQGYRQRVFKTVTDKDGAFAFPKRYDSNQQNAFLVSIVADGWAMESKYVLKKQGNKQRPFKFKMEPAMAKTFVFEDEDGNVLDRVNVFPSNRKTAKGDDHLIYGQSAPDVEAETNNDGEVSMNYFKVGDTASFGVAGASIEVEVDDQAEQVVSLKKNQIEKVPSNDGRLPQ